MTASIIGKRYGTALLALADESNEVDKVRDDLDGFVALWNESDDLRRVFENPEIAAESRSKILEDIVAEARLSDVTRRTLLLLADRKRIGHIGEIRDAYHELADRRTGRLHAEVITASPLSDAYFSELQKTLEGVTGKPVVLVRREDPSIIGGVVTRVGDRVFDGSLRNHLDELEDELLAQGA